MARRKRKDDVPDWTAPEFDEVGYMRTEIGAARAAVATIAWALVGAAVSFLLYSVHPALAFFSGILVGLRAVPRLRQRRPGERPGGSDAERPSRVRAECDAADRVQPMREPHHGDVSRRHVQRLVRLQRILVRGDDRRAGSQRSRGNGLVPDVPHVTGDGLSFPREAPVEEPRPCLGVPGSEGDATGPDPHGRPGGLLEILAEA